MYNNDSVIEKRVDSLKNQFETAQDDFQKNLKPSLIKYEYNILTKALLENIDTEIHSFLERNEIGISVYVTTLNDNLIILGNTLIDEIVWEQIVNENINIKI